MAEDRARLAKLRDLVVLDTPPEPLFDSLTRMASQVCGMPIALLSLVDEQRQWFKSNVGLPGVNETPRDIAFCAHAIEADAVMEVSDASLDARFKDNALVTGGPEIRFYAGAPLILKGGERVGTLCVIDRQPNRLDESQLATLRELARMATQALEMRRDLISRALEVREEFEQALVASEGRYRALVQDQTDAMSLARADGTLVMVNPAFAQIFGATAEELAGRNLFELVAGDDVEAVRRRLAKVIETGESVRGESRLVTADGTPRWMSWTNQRHLDLDGEPMLHSVGRDISERKAAEVALRSAQSFLLRTGRVAGVGGWELDIPSGAVTWSDETRRIHGVPPGFTPTLDTAIAFYTAESRPVIEAAVQQSMADGTPWDLELQIINAAGDLIWARAVGEAEFENGAAVRLVGAFQDITERKHLEIRVVDSERLLRQIADSVPIRIAYVDADRRFRFVNQAHCRRFDRAQDEILGRTREELDRPMDDETRARLDAVLRGEAQKFEFDELVHGQMRRIESQLIPDVDEEGRVHGFYSTGIDITERAASERTLRELTAILENTTDFIVQTDRRGTVVYMNPAVRALVGLAADAPLSGQSFAGFNTAETNALYSEVIVDTVKAKGVWVGETTVYGAGRRVVPVSHMVLAHLDSNGKIGRYSAVMRDISASIRSKRELEQQAATLRSVAEAIPAIMAVVGVDGRYRFVNSTFERWAGAVRETIVGKTLVEVLGRVEFERSKPYIERVFAGETVSFEKAYLHAGRPTHLSISYVPLWLSNECVDGFVAVAQDITSHRQENVRLANLAQQDPLTGLLNRAGFEEFIQHALRTEGATSLALICIDLDRFKAVNDTYGHPAGDAVLRTFAQRLRSLVRPSDAVARLGGDEFAIALVGMRLQSHADTVAEKVVAQASLPVAHGSQTLQVGASAGVAFASAEDDWKALLERADAMLYRAKGAGRGRHATEHGDVKL